MGNQQSTNILAYLAPPLSFTGTTNSFQDSKIIFFGVPLDATSSFKPGSRFGPNAVREASLELEPFFPETNSSINKTKFADIGNLWVSQGNIQATLERAELLCKEIVKQNKIPFALGGEHTVTSALIKPLAEKHPELTLIYFDAHADIKQEYNGDKICHATTARLCLANGIRPENLILIGTRSLSEEEFSFIKQNKIKVLWSDEIKKNPTAATEKIKELTKNKKIYLSFDIDVMDISLVPATSTPEPNGLTFSEAAELIKSVKGKVLGLDMTEIGRDQELITPITAAKLIFVMLNYLDFD